MQTVVHTEWECSPTCEDPERLAGGHARSVPGGGPGRAGVEEPSGEATSSTSRGQGCKLPLLLATNRKHGPSFPEGERLAALGAPACRGPAGAGTGGEGEQRGAPGDRGDPFVVRQRAAEGWAPCSGDDPGVDRSAALRRGSRCSRELLPSPGGRTRPHCATCAARVCPGTTAAPWARSPGSQGCRPENAFPRLTCHHGQRHQREALERDGEGVRKKPAPRADAGAGAGGPRRRALQETSRSALRATVTTDGAASVAPTGPKAAASPSPSP